MSCRGEFIRQGRLKSPLQMNSRKLFIARSLIAYHPPSEKQTGNVLLVEFLSIDFYKVGGHENFYDELKRYMKEGE